MWLSFWVSVFPLVKGREHRIHSPTKPVHIIVPTVWPQFSHLEMETFMRFKRNSVLRALLIAWHILIGLCTLIDLLWNWKQFNFNLLLSDWNLYFPTWAVLGTGKIIHYVVWVTADMATSAVGLEMSCNPWFVSGGYRKSSSMQNAVSLSGCQIIFCPINRASRSPNMLALPLVGHTDDVSWLWASPIIMLTTSIANLS